MANDSAYLPDFKDQVASVPAGRRPPQDPDGLLWAGVDATRATLSPASFQAETLGPLPVASDSNNNIVGQGDVSERIKPPATTRASSDEDHPVPSATSATDAPIAFAVTDADAVDTLTRSHINNNRNDAFLSTGNNHDTRKNCCALALALIAGMLVAGAVVGGACSTGHCSGGGSSPESKMTPSPTPATPIREQNIANFINSKTYTGVDLTSYGTTPEGQALLWLINDDPLQLNVGDEDDEIHLLQRYSLSTLWFQGDTGTAWIDSTNWLKAGECTWAGIDCESGVVTTVNLAANGLQGTLSPDLGFLSDLTWLDISSNRVAGSLPSEIGLWTDLLVFSVEINDLSGYLPTEIVLWRSLTFFNISANGLTGSLPLEMFPRQLYDFDCSFNALTGSLPTEIGLWTQLWSFNVEENFLTGSLPTEIGLWTQLWVFGVEHNFLTGSLPSELGSWTSLTDFDCSLNFLTGSLPSELGSWTSLTNFDCSFNSLTGTLPSEIVTWRSLTLFECNGNTLTGTIPDTIANWTLIEQAWFDTNDFDGSMPDGICELISGPDILSADCELNCSCCTLWC